MTDDEQLVREEIEATIDRAGFERLSPEAIRVGVTDSFRRKLGECRALDTSADTVETGTPATDTPGPDTREPSTPEPRYEIRIARRLFEATNDDQWRDTVRHELAHAYVLETVGLETQPHGEAWRNAARRAGADPVARYEGDDTVDAEYVLACPKGCFERGYLQRSKRIKQPWLYTCDECGTQPISYDVGARPTDPTPGTCYVESIPWRTADGRGENVDEDGRQSAARYLLACPNGCTAWPYQRRTKRIKNPWRYSCPECDATLLSCDIDDRPTDLEPGRCHVASIPWREPQLVYGCPNGCFRVELATHTEASRHPERHRCEECGARTVSFSYSAEDRSDSLDPGTNYGE